MEIFEKLEITLLGDREIVYRRSFNAPRQLLWRAHTEPELVKRWMAGPPGWSMPTCEIDLRVGGAYRYVWADEEGNPMGMGGVHQIVDEPAHLACTQNSDNNWLGGESIMDLRFEEENGRTTLTNSVTYPSAAARELMISSGLAGELEGPYQRIDEMLAGMSA